MNRPTFFNGVWFAAIIAGIGGVVLTVLTPLVDNWLLNDLLYPALALSYILYLRSRSTERVGWAVAIAIWLCATAVTWFTGASLAEVLLVHLTTIWLIRSLYFYSSVWASLADLALILFSTASAFWVVVHTGSVFLSVWCFFLLQALFTAIPSTLNARKKDPSSPDANHDSFDRASRRAEAAVKQLFSN